MIFFFDKLAQYMQETGTTCYQVLLSHIPTQWKFWTLAHIRLVQSAQQVSSLFPFKVQTSRKSLHQILNSWVSVEILHKSLHHALFPSLQSTLSSQQAKKTFQCYYKPSNSSYVLWTHNPSPSEISTWMAICWGVTAFFSATSFVLCWLLGACGFCQRTVKKVLPFENEETLKEKRQKRRQKLMEELKAWRGGGGGGVRSKDNWQMRPQTDNPLVDGSRVATELSRHCSTAASQ